MKPAPKQNITLVTLNDFIAPEQRFPKGRFHIAPENARLVRRAAREIGVRVEFIPAGERLAVQAGARCDQLVERFKELQVRRRPVRIPTARPRPALRFAPQAKPSKVKPSKRCLSCPATIEFRSAHQFASQKYCAACAAARIQSKRRKHGRR